MSNAKKCDRCGAYYARHKRADGEMCTDGFRFSENDMQNQIDLCPDCMKELKNWFNTSLENVIENPNKICEDKELYERIRYFKKWFYNGRI